MKLTFTKSLLVLCLVISRTWALSLDLDDLNSVKEATSKIVDGILDYYVGNKEGQTIGMFSSPYYWWHAGAAWGSLIDFWHYVGNDTLNDLITTSLLYQAGDTEDYMPLNQTVTEGNDDQAFWGIAVMSAAEKNFPNPPEDQPQWLALAQGVFNTMARRWDTDTCGGGLRWQIYMWNTGYDYKNTVSNGALFHLAARLARYTGNDSYVQWAERVYDWLTDVKLVDNSTGWYLVYDGANIKDECAVVSKLQWSYNQGFLLSGCAYLYNYTENEIWHTRTKEFMRATSAIFFRRNDSILYESACQDVGTCDNDQRGFRSYLARFMGLTAQLVPETSTQIRRLLRISAIAAAKSCDGGRDGHTCGLNWSLGTFDGKYGLGEQTSALEVIQNTMFDKVPGPLTEKTGGTSLGNPGAGGINPKTLISPLDIDSKDKAGAGMLTAIIGVSFIASIIWLMV